jgi:hypothetical protein
MDALVEIFEFHRPVYIFRKNYLSTRRFSANVSPPRPEHADSIGLARIARYPSQRCRFLEPL